MKISIVAFLALLGLGAWTLPAGAQPTVRLTSDQVTTLQGAVQDQDFAAATALLDQLCRALLDESRSETATVSERTAAARGAVECAESISATASSLAEGANYFAARDVFAQATAPIQTNARVRQAEEEFLGLRWGVGLGFSVSDSDIIPEAEIVDGTVRAVEDRTERPRALLEYHKYFWCNGKGTVRNAGCGPFVAVAATEDKVLSGVGIGFMYGRKAAPEDNDGFSIGVGFVLDDNVKHLAEGFRVNQDAPPGATEVRYTTKARWSFLLFVTRTF